MIEVVSLDLFELNKQTYLPVLTLGPDLERDELGLRRKRETSRERKSEPFDTEGLDV